MKKILLMRPDNREDADYFKRQGYEIVELPLSRYVLRDLTPNEIGQLQASDWVLFSSKVPVEAVASHILPAQKIAVIGGKTAEIVRRQGLTVNFQPSSASRQALEAEWRPDGTIFYPKSNLAKNWPDAHNVSLYENQPDAENLAKLPKLLASTDLTAAYFASPSSWRRFYEVYQESPKSLDFLAIGRTTQAAIEACGAQASILVKSVL